MASVTPATPATVEPTIASHLNTIAKKSDSAKSTHARGSFPTNERLGRVSIRLQSLGNYAESRALTRKEKKERQALYDGLRDINKELETLDSQEQIQLLSGTSTPTAEQAKEAAQLRDTIKRQAEAANAEQAAASDYTELEDVDAKNIEIARAAYQHYLLYNSDFFAHYHKTNLLQTKRVRGGYKPISNDIIKTIGYVKKDYTNQPRIFLLDENEDSTIVDNKLNFCPGNEKFVDVTTAEYAGLQPLLRIFKVYRNKKGRANSKVELQFGNQTGLEGIDGPVKLFHPVGTGFDAIHIKGIECGVKSFDWIFKGTDSFTATRDIEATLVLHAQSFAALSKERQGIDLIGRPIPEDYKYLDLIIQPDCSELNSTTSPQPYNNVYDPGCYEIQIDVGYALQDGDLRDATCCQYNSLYLVHVDHKFEFKDDGTLDLTITYRGRLETIMRDKKFNVLLPGGGFYRDTGGPGSEGIYEYNRNDKDLRKERRKPSPSESKIKELERERERILFNLRQYTYSLILETMEDQGMIHTVELEHDHFLQFARWKEPEFAGALPDKLSVGTLSPTTGAEADTASIQFKIVQNKDPDTNAISAALEEIKGQTEKQMSQRLQAAVSAKKHTINYVYFGDLLATVIANVFGEIDVGEISGGRVRWRGGIVQEFTGGRKSLALKKRIYKNLIENYHVILGNIKIIDAMGNSKQVNLAHIPISLDSYQDFMMKNVISQQIDYYPLTDFIDDIVGDLITDMFSGEHHVGLVEADSRVSISTLTGKSTRSGNKSLRKSKIFKKVTTKYKVLDVSSIDADNLPFGKDSRCAENHLEPQQYLIVNTLNSYPKNLAGDYLGNQGRGDNIGDKNRGIMHFTYGRDRGLLKSVQFSKTDQEYVPEARFASSDGSVLNQLSSVYDATFNMIGNNLFKPGMLLYFDPEPMGVGKPWQFKADSDGNAISRSWSNIMGIGGYHLITEVAHSIGPGKFDTNVKARWVTSGEDKSP